MLLAIRMVLEQGGGGWLGGVGSVETSGWKKDFRGNVVGLEVEREWLVFTFGGVYFEKMMYGRSLHLGCFGRKEEEEGE